MDDRERSEEARLSAIRQRARTIEQSERPIEERENVEPGVPMVSAWRSARRRMPGGWDADREGWTPRAHVFERGGHLIARVELPGLDRKDVEVHVENDCLIVEGERPDDRPAEERTQRGERRYGPFRREFPLPHPADPSDVKATFRNGLLEVVVPQPSREERRKPIRVET